MPAAKAPPGKDRSTGICLNRATAERRDGSLLADGRRLNDGFRDRRERAVATHRRHTRCHELVAPNRSLGSPLAPNHRVPPVSAPICGAASPSSSFGAASSASAGWRSTATRLAARNMVMTRTGPSIA
jgi:hypothetical protein